MKIKYTVDGKATSQFAELVLENVGVNRFRVSIPLQDGAGKVVARAAEIEAASEKTKAGITRIMLKCTIPYYPQVIDSEGRVVVDSSRGPKPYTLHIVHTVPAIMASEALNSTFARQVAQVAVLASQVVSLGIIPGDFDFRSEGTVNQVPVQTGSTSVDGVASYPLTDSHITVDDPDIVATINNVDVHALTGSMLGRALTGLMPFDINTDRTVAAPCAGRLTD